MTKMNKIIEKMNNNPKDWQLSDLEIIANRLRITVRKGKGSHVIFSHPAWIEILCVPAHRPIKPIYIKKFIHLLSLIEEIDEVIA